MLKIICDRIIDKAIAYRPEEDKPGKKRPKQEHLNDDRKRHFTRNGIWTEYR